MIQIKNENVNSLLKRTEIQGMFQSSTNPGFDKVREYISQAKKVPQENIAIKLLRNNYGANEFLVEAFIYQSLAHKDRIEQKPKPKKKTA